MPYRIQAFLEFESVAHAQDAQAQLQARMVNTSAFGGPLGLLQSYSRLSGPDGEMISQFFVDRFSIVRTGEPVAPPEGQYDAWVQPIGAQDAYPLLDALGEPVRVTHDGRNWQNTTAANVWSPGVFGWTDLGPV
jgi:hypothetical protein